MPSRRRTGLWIVGILGVAGLTGAFALFAPRGHRAEAPATAGGAIDEKTPMADLARALRDSDARALAVLFQKIAAKTDAPPAPLSEAEAAEWVEALKGMRTGFPRFGSYGRSSALTVVGRLFQRLAADPAPQNWVDALAPAQDLFSAGLNDTHLDVRVTALVEVGKVWSWLPGKTPSAHEENALTAWHESFVTPATRRLGDSEPKARAAAVACLGYLPVDGYAAAALPYMDDPNSPEVRKQVFISFARRPSLLTEDMLLKHSLDDEGNIGIKEVVDLVLKTRGLNQEQISLGGMIFHPKPEIRASVISLLKNRTDIDPAVWLMQLSHDVDETVRMGAVEALATRITPEVGQRLAEMAATDKSPAVRKAASKYLPDVEKTAALPPLPGSKSLNPTAN